MYIEELRTFFSFNKKADKEKRTKKRKKKEQEGVERSRKE